MIRSKQLIVKIPNIDDPSVSFFKEVGDDNDFVHHSRNLVRFFVGGAHTIPPNFFGSSPFSPFHIHSLHNNLISLIGSF